MKYSTVRYSEELYRNNIYDFYFSGMRTGVLDIETTGLDPSRNRFILGGLYDCGTCTIHQYFAEKRSEEPEALAGFLSVLDSLDMVITYNGRHFDMPFIEKRLRAVSEASGSVSGMQLPCDTYNMPYDLDLYLVLNGHSPIRRFVPNMKQKTVENYMGLWQDRKDEISGAESVELYDRYEKTGDDALKEKILLHNSDDILQLTRLTKVINKCDFHKAMFYLGFPAGPLTISKIRTGRDYIDISGIQRTCAVDYRSFMGLSCPADARFSSTDRTFTIRLPAVRDSGLLIVDLEAFGIDKSGFSIYPGYGSGFLVIEDPSGHRHMEINHFIKEFLRGFMMDMDA